MCVDEGVYLVCKNRFYMHMYITCFVGKPASYRCAFVTQDKPNNRTINGTQFGFLVYSQGVMGWMCTIEYAVENCFRRLGHI